MKSSLPLPSDIVWFTSFLKSGSTCTHSVVRLAGNKYAFPQLDLDVYILIDDERSPVFSEAVKPDITNSEYTILKTHNRWMGDDILDARLNLQTGSKDSELRIFKNRMRLYYYVEYFSEKLIVTFLNKFHAQLKLFGYDDLPH